MRWLPAIRSLARSVAFAYVMALIMVVGSERMFWFWTPGLRSHVEVAGFYAIATGTAIALVRRYRVDSWWSLLLVVPVVAYVVEGVITPMLYVGGPLVPFFPMWFTGWHGIMSLGALVFVVRRLVLDESCWRLTLLAAGFGVFWGAWASTASLPESRSDPDLVAELGTLVVLEPWGFAGYACLFTVVLIVGHGLIGFVWPLGSDDRRARSAARSGRLSVGERVLAGAVLLGSAMWTLAVPWALPMFVVYVSMQLVALRRHRAQTPIDRADLFATLAGHVRLRALAPLLVMAPSAAFTYATIWRVGPGDATLRLVMYSTIAVQTVGAAALVIGAGFRVMRPARRLGRDRSTGIDVDATDPRPVAPRAC